MAFACRKHDAMRKEILGYPAYQYSIFRVIFGFYLFLHFIHLIGSSPDIWSNMGIFADPSLNFTFGMFPNILNWMDSPLEVRIFVSFNALLSLGLLFGVYRRTCCLLLWYGWACLFHRNNLISNPGIPFVGWLLLANVLVPIGEPLCWRKKVDPSWSMPAILFYGAWLITGLAYCASGIDKLGSPSWVDGSAIHHLLHNPLARDWFLRDLLLDLPLSMINFLTWFTLALEIGFCVLCIFRKTRLWAWILIMLMHLGILSLVSFADLTFGMLMVHFFTFDPRWFGENPRKGEKKVVLFDGVCGMCNRSVNLLMSIDARNLLLFSPLQGEFAAREAKEDAKDLQTIIFFDNGKIYKRSTAVVRILTQLGGVWSIARIFLLFPSILRDTVYRWIANNRYKWFGKSDACRLPTKEEREKFLD